MQMYTGFQLAHGAAGSLSASAIEANDLQMVRVLQTLLAEPQAVQAGAGAAGTTGAPATTANPALTPGNVSGCSSLPIVTIQCLLESVKSSSSTTFQEFMIEVGRNAEKLRQSSYNTISMVAGSGLFIRWISRQPFLQDEPFESWKARVLEYGARMVKSCYGFRDKAASSGLLFIKDDQTILVHSYSRAVMALLLKSAADNKRFNVMVTESRPECSGKKVVAELRQAGIPAALIHDAAVGHIIDTVDLVLVGCEAVVQNGGIINQIGTYQAAVVAKAVNKPFYVVAESYKFVQLFPLNQSDLPIPHPAYFPAAMMKQESVGELQSESNIVASNPAIDYTPPEYITLLFSNAGVLTPSAVSEQLIMTL